MYGSRSIGRLSPLLPALAVAGSLLLFTAWALAQAEETKSVQYGIEGWNFATAQIDKTVKGFLIWADPETESVGDDFRILWLERGSQGAWTVWAWKTNDLATAADWVRSQKKDLAIFSDDPWANEKIFNANVAVGTAPDPTQVVYLQDTFLNSVDSCLEELAVDAEARLGTALQAVQSAQSSQAVQVAQAAALCWPCSCTTTTGATTCGAWVFSFSVPATGGGLTCHYTRTCTTPWTRTGRWWYCWSCAGSGTSTTTQTGRTTVPPGDPCVPPPP